MDERELRLQCLRLANGGYYEAEPISDEVLKAAQKFYEFVSGVREADGQYSFHLGEQG